MNNDNLLPQFKILDLIKDNHVYFLEYRKGVLWYYIHAEEVPGLPTNTYKFPVPITDIGDATFCTKERAIMTMRYLRTAINEGTFVVVNL